MTTPNPNPKSKNQKPKNMSDESLAFHAFAQAQTKAQSQAMTTAEILELASLDAMGVLDPEDHQAFERAFQSAHPSIQAQIRREQTRFSRMDDILPNIEPPLGLKARVIEAMKTADPSRSFGDHPSVDADATRRHAGGLRLHKPVGVNRFWRVGFIASVAACLAMGVMTVQIFNQQNDLITAGGNTDAGTMLAKQLGNRASILLFAEGSQLVHFSNTAAPGSASGNVTLVLDPTGANSVLMVKNLPGNQRYELVQLDANGKATMAFAFNVPSNGLLYCTELRKFNLEGVHQLAIRLQGSDEILMKAQI